MPIHSSFPHRRFRVDVLKIAAFLGLVAACGRPVGEDATGSASSVFVSRAAPMSGPAGTNKVPVTRGGGYLSAGYLHTCALTTKGAVKCWGYNANGQLGDNTTANSLTPVTVYGLTKGVKAVSAAYTGTCAISSKGAAKCWGSNNFGQLGHNSTTNSNKPVTVYGLTKGVKQISVGQYSTCAVSGKGKALCWGLNANGQLGDNSTTNSPKPVGVYGLGSGIQAVKTAVYHSCALTSKGKVRCWGYNGYGGLGDNSTTDSPRPVNVYNLDKATKLSVGYLHTCVATARKAVKCWGYNTYGQVGDNTTTNTSHPVKVFGY
mgnify:CR=1 FL=1